MAINISIQYNTADPMILPAGSIDVDAINTFDLAAKNVLTVFPLIE